MKRRKKMKIGLFWLLLLIALAAGIILGIFLGSLFITGKVVESIDGDNGLDFYTASFCIDESGIYADECVNENSLYEYHLNEAGKCVKTPFGCQYKGMTCENGACIEK